MLNFANLRSVTDGRCYILTIKQSKKTLLGLLTLKRPESATLNSTYIFEKLTVACVADNMDYVLRRAQITISIFNKKREFDQILILAHTGTTYILKVHFSNTPLQLESNSNLHSARILQRSATQPLPTTSSRTSAVYHMQ